MSLSSFQFNKLLGFVNREDAALAQSRVSPKTVDKRVSKVLIKKYWGVSLTDPDINISL